jgi:hypothetical protein
VSWRAASRTDRDAKGLHTGAVLPTRVNAG